MTIAASYFDLQDQAVLGVDLAGKDVLDIGGYDGRCAKLALDHGARSATLVDSEQWRDYGWPVPTIPSGVRYVVAESDAYHTPADVVICNNSLTYHHPAPWLALQHVRTLTREVLCLCSPVEDIAAYCWRVTDPSEDANLHTRPGPFSWYWRPSRSGLIRLLERVGFATIETVGEAQGHLVLRCR